MLFKSLESNSIKKYLKKKELRSAKRTNYISRIEGAGEGVLKLDSILAE